jgi:hypothetical protein
MAIRTDKLGYKRTLILRRLKKLRDQIVTYEAVLAEIDALILERDRATAAQRKAAAKRRKERNLGKNTTPRRRMLNNESARRRRAENKAAANANV